ILLYKKEGFNFRGVYVGGGTPTVEMGELIETLDLLRETFPLDEISVETNPNHLTETNCLALKKAGVNRLSVGVQSFDDSLLRDMDRYEKYGNGTTIASRLKELLGTFDTLNADMIFNFPTQSTEMLARDIDTILELGLDQVTYYPLMVSDFTKKKVVEKLGKIDYGKEKRFYRQIVSRLVPPYRFSSAWCFSKKKGAMIDEYIVDYDEYAGLGSGSIGYLNGLCYANTFNIKGYIAQVEKGELPIMATRVFTKKDQMRYDFVMKLFGMKLDVPAMELKYGGAFLRTLWFEVSAFILAGRLRWREPYFHLTPWGWYSWVIMMREFFTAVNNFRDFCREQN
ncbi:MAG: coproporphyrinogen III oxidase family protein, partial [Smithellaceae bacterium]|nr:coproporphyrinogen III oxidase family protein [Smithellaceae bacterium]